MDGVRISSSTTACADRTRSHFVRLLQPIHFVNLNSNSNSNSNSKNNSNSNSKNTLLTFRFVGAASQPDKPSCSPHWINPHSDHHDNLVGGARRARTYNPSPDAQRSRGAPSLALPAIPGPIDLTPPRVSPTYTRSYTCESRFCSEQIYRRANPRNRLPDCITY